MHLGELETIKEWQRISALWECCPIPVYSKNIVLFVSILVPLRIAVDSSVDIKLKLEAGILAAYARCVVHQDLPFSGHSLLSIYKRKGSLL